MQMCPNTLQADTSAGLMAPVIIPCLEVAGHDGPHSAANVATFGWGITVTWEGDAPMTFDLERNY